MVKVVVRRSGEAWYRYTTSLVLIVEVKSKNEKRACRGLIAEAGVDCHDV